jgi:hypothetical protein
MGMVKVSWALYWANLVQAFDFSLPLKRAFLYIFFFFLAKIVFLMPHFD